jgi:cytochrome c
MTRLTTALTTASLTLGGIMVTASPSICQDVDAGQLLFNNACRTCHSVKEGDNRLGPSLYKVLGRKAGSLPNYDYSSSMRSADFFWDKGKLDHFIANPDTVVHGNNMKPYGGLASADARAKVIAFLESLTNGQ